MRASDNSDRGGGSETFAIQSFAKDQSREVSLTRFLKGTVEYADCISKKRGRTLSTTSILDMTQNHLMMLLKSWNFAKFGVALHFHNSYVHSDPEG